MGQHKAGAQSRRLGISSLQLLLKRTRNTSSSNVIWFRFRERLLNRCGCLNNPPKAAPLSAVPAITPAQAADLVKPAGAMSG